MSRRRFQFTAAGWYKLVMMPTIVLVCFGLCWTVYRELYAAIIRGFEQKLSAVSTVVAAFIDPREHALLMEQPEIAGLAFAPPDRLLAIDAAHHVLLKIHAENGLADPHTVPVRPGLGELAYSRTSDTFFALEEPSGKLYRLNPATGGTAFLLNLGEKAQSIAVTEDGTLLVLADRLLRVDLPPEHVVPVGAERLPEITGAGYDSDRKVLCAITAAGEFITLAPDSGRVLTRHPLAADALRPGEMTYDWQHHVLLGTGRSILKIGPVTAEIEPAHFLAAYGKELLPEYRHLLAPMREIMNRLELTYLYTETLHDQNKLTYGVDATQGQEHSPLQSEDTVPESEVLAYQRLMRYGELHHFPITKSEPWGLLKSVVVPVFDGAGNVVAIVGSDIEVSIIENQTRTAMLQLFAVGGASLLFAAAVTLVIARHVRQPLEQIKSTALAVAIGEYSRRITLQSPREAGALGRAFNRMATALESSVTALQSSIQELLEIRMAHELARRLSRPHDLHAALRELPGITLTRPETGRDIVSASGAIRQQDRILVWLAASPADALEAARRGAALARRMAAELRAGEGARPSLPAGVRARVTIEPRRRVVQVYAEPAVGVVTPTPDSLHLSDGDVAIEFTGYAVEIHRHDAR